jgi:hypothetical protein
MALSLTAELKLTATHTAVLDLGTASFNPSFLAQVNLTSGTGANQADQLFTDQRTVTASANDDLDLAGVLTNAFGATVTFVRLKGILVKAASANTNNINIGGLGANGFLTWVGATGDFVVLRPGGFFGLMCADATGYAVTAGTADLLRITNAAGGTSVVYDIALIGATA